MDSWRFNPLSARIRSGLICLQNHEAEQQIKFFQSRVAAAFSERDRALMEVVKTHQSKAEMSDKLNQLHNRIEEITADCVEEKRLSSELQSDLSESKAEITKLKQASMQDELAASRDMVENLRKQLEEAYTSKDLLVKRVDVLESMLKHSEDTIKNELTLLRIFQVEKRNDVLNLMEEERKWLVTMAEELQNEVKQHFLSRLIHSNSLDLNEKRPCISLQESGNIEVNVQSCFHANTEVAALLLLSQQEERHLLEKNTNAALHEKIKELQQKLLQDSSNATSTTLINEKDGRVKHLLKRAYLKHWLRGIDIPVLKASAHVDRDDISSTPSKPSDAMDFARLKVENASLQESMANMEHLTTSIHRLRLSLLKAKEDANISAPGEAALEAIDGIINEAQHIKTALGSSLPVSWSAESGVDAHVSSESEIEPENTEDRMNSGLDSVSAAGFELVELLILAAKLQKIELTARMIISNDS